MPIKYVHRRIKHHAGHSGYDILFKSLGLEPAQSKFMRWILKILPEGLIWRMTRLKPQKVKREGFDPEIQALPYTAFGKNKLCHFIYGEDTFFFTPLWANKHNKIVATYHYPPSRLEERVNPAVLACLDHIVVVSNCQKPYFERFLPGEKITFIPHHVDTSYFKPLESDTSNSKLKVVSIGNILRDNELLKKCIFQLSEALDDKVQFDLIMPSEHNAFFETLPNVNMHNGISDEHLLSLYQGADVGFMPLLDCTANNGVLEMMACGLPIVTTPVGGIQDYVDEQGACFIQHHSESVALSEELIKLTALMSDRTKLKQMGHYNRNKAIEQFSLNVIQTKIMTLYQDLIKDIS